VCVGSDGNAEGASQSKVCKLDHALRIDQQVLRFEIAVKHAVLVTVLEAAKQLIHVALHQHGRKGVILVRKEMVYEIRGRNGQRMGCGRPYLDQIGSQGWALVNVALEVLIQELEHQVQLVVV